MIKRIFNDRTPGRVANALLIALTSLWCFWSIGEMYHEGWWGNLFNKLIYLSYGSVFFK